MTDLTDEQIAEIREQIHALNNALNATSMQAELVRMLARDSQSYEKISRCVDVIIGECKKSGEMARDVSRIIKTAVGT